MQVFIGLGGDCQVAHQIGRVFKNREKHFFDWLIIPVTTTIRLLDERFAHFMGLTDLQAEYDNGVLMHVRDKRNNTVFMHDFHAFDNENIDTAQAKYIYLADKFLSALEDGIPKIFVRQWHILDGDNTDEAAHCLLRSLHRYNPDHQLVYVHADALKPEILGNSYTSIFVQQTPGEWTGPDDTWDYIFNTLTEIMPATWSYIST
jgi:hypothetical protein